MKEQNSSSTTPLATSHQTLAEAKFLCTCFGDDVAARRRELSNGEKIGIRPNLLLAVFIGFTKDPLPDIRETALDGLSRSVVFYDLGLVSVCLGRSVALLHDFHPSVRSSAVRAVIRWGKILLELNPDDTKKDISDALFIQLCSMVRDMSVKVRVEAFNALGELRLLSDEILLQTLSKKVLPLMKEKKYDVLCSEKPLQISASSTAGAFVHGLEDEFCEVRRSACLSLQTLSILSMNFAEKSLNLLIEVLNDDSMRVRLQALETMRCMALYNHLKLQETHMHMFLSTLVDSNALVRTAAREVLRVANLSQMSIFRLCTEGLLENLEMHSQDEADVLSVLFHTGRSHGTFAVKVVEGVLDQIEPFTNGNLGFDNRRIAAILVLAISAPLSNQQKKCPIPPRIFSYAVTMLGRISRALGDVVDQDTLLAYLSHCSRFDYVSEADFQFTKRKPLDKQLEESFDQVRNGVELILEKIKDIWKLVQLGFVGDVQKALSDWKEELATFTSDLTSDAIAFTYMYLKVIKVLAMMWPYFLSRKRDCYKNGNLYILLEKLDKILREIKYRFIGLCELEELHVLELMLLNFVIRLSSIEAFCGSTTLKNLENTLSRMEFLSKEKIIQLSEFVIGLKKLLGEIDFGIEPPFYNPFLFRKLLELFSLTKIVVSGKLKHIKAELEVQKNDFENPFCFIAGLPVGIPLDITLYNISREHRLWLKLVVNEALMGFVFLDLDQYGGNGSKIKEFSFVAPFYKTPGASSFSIKIYLGIECFSEDINFPKHRGGPKQELIYLCKEKEVFFSVGLADSY